jgi:hypothetical protein
VHDRHDFIGSGVSRALGIVIGQGAIGYDTCARAAHERALDPAAGRTGNTLISYAQCDRSVGRRLRLLR